MALRATGTRVRPGERERAGVSEVRQLLERVLLSVAGLAAAHKTAVVRIVVTARALLAGTEKTLLAVPNPRGVRVRVTRLAVERRVYAGETELDVCVLELSAICDTSECEGSFVDQLDRVAVVLAVAAFASFDAGQLPMKPAAFRELNADLDVAGRTRSGHVPPALSMALVATRAARECQLAGVRRRQRPRRHALRVERKQREHDRERQYTKPQSRITPLHGVPPANEAYRNATKTCNATSSTISSATQR